jgi:hypothetical protein
MMKNPKIVYISIRDVIVHKYPFCENNFNEIVVFKDDTYAGTISFQKKDFHISWNHPEYSEITLIPK